MSPSRVFLPFIRGGFFNDPQTPVYIVAPLDYHFVLLSACKRGKKGNRKCEKGGDDIKGGATEITYTEIQKREGEKEKIKGKRRQKRGNRKCERGNIKRGEREPTHKEPQKEKLMKERQRTARGKREDARR